MSDHARPTRIVLVGDEGDGDILRSICTAAPFLHSVLLHVSSLDELLSLSADASFDVVLLAIPSTSDRGTDMLRRTVQVCSGTPVIVIADRCTEHLQHLLMRLGAWKVLQRHNLTPDDLVEALKATSSDRKPADGQKQRQTFEEVLHLLQHRSVPGEAPLMPEGALRPLSEVMPSRFLELAKSYSNIIDLALARAGLGRQRFSGHSVSQQLRYLAADLGALNASAWDVLDVHAKALEGRAEEAVRSETKQLLIELLRNLDAFYKHAQYSFA